MYADIHIVFHDRITDANIDSQISPFYNSL